MLPYMEKKDFADVIKSLERKEIILNYLDWHNVITSILRRQRQEAQTE